MMKTITNEDNMVMMARYPDKHFDLAIVDPPYGLGASNVKRGGRQYGNSCAKSKNYGKKDWDNSIPKPDYFKELFRTSKNQIMWGGNFMTGLLPPSSCWIVWDKLTGDNGYADFELAWTSFYTAARKFTFRWQGMLQGNMAEKEIRFHPTQKPVTLYKWLLDKYAKPGDKILDTHLGSGSIAIACHDYGYDLTACELDPDYYNAAMQRIKQHTDQLKIF